jgi:hypothetical protein
MEGNDIHDCKNLEWFSMKKFNFRSFSVLWFVS